MNNILLSVRIAIPEDSDKIIELKNKLAKESSFLPYTDREIEMDLSMQKDIAEGRDIYALLVNNKEIVGYCNSKQYDLPDSEFNCVIIGILSKYCGHGYGVRLLNYLLSKAMECGYSKFYLYVSVLNTIALSAYQKCGFTIKATGFMDDDIDGIYGELHMLELI